MSCKDCAMFPANGGSCLGLAQIKGHSIVPVMSIAQAEAATDLFEPKADDCSGFISKQKQTASQQFQLVSMLSASALAIGGLFFTTPVFRFLPATIGGTLFVAAAHAYKSDARYEAERKAELVQIMSNHHSK